MPAPHAGTVDPRSAPDMAARDRILRAAKRGLAAGSLPALADIARDAGVSRATLYRLVASRGQLLQLLEVEPDPTSHDRILAEAVGLIGEHGLAGLSMDELAERAGLSRASLYRLFPGKAALFRELVRAKAPFVPMARALAEHASEPPERVMPLIALVMVGSTQGREGLLRSMFFEVSGPGPDAELARGLAFSETIGPLAAYVASQMTAGRLRQMNPLLALLTFVGPLIMHILTRDVARRAFGFEMPLEAVAEEMAAAWLRAMAPEPGTAA